MANVRCTGLVQRTFMAVRPAAGILMAKNDQVQRAISKERPAQAGYYSILDRYESLHLCD